MKTLGVINGIILSLFTVLSICILSGTIAFGYGYGDIIYYFAIWISTLILWVILIVNGKNVFQRSWILALAFGGLLIYFLYAMSVGRGTEDPWNGKFFYDN